MCYKKLLTLIFLGILISLSGIINADIILNSSENLSTRNGTENFVIVNPNQLRHLEKTIHLLLARIAVPIKEPIALRINSRNNTLLQKSISRICESIRGQLSQFALACGLVRTTQRNEFATEPEPNLLSEVLVQGSLLFSDLGRMANEIWRSTDGYFQKQNIILFEGNNDSIVSTRQINEFRFLGTADDLTRSSNKLMNCLQNTISRNSKKSNSFKLNNVILYFLKRSPNNFAKRLGDKFDETLLGKSSNYLTKFQQLYAVFCSSVIHDKNQYVDCIQELENLNNCITNKRLLSTSQTVDQPIVSKRWLRAIQHLSDCKTTLKNGDAYIRCKTKYKMPRNIRNRVRFIYEKMLNRKIPKGSALYRVSNELGNVFSKSDFGNRLSSELWQFLAVYDDGKKKLQKFSAAANMDKNSVSSSYRKVSRAFKVYRKGLLLKTIDTIKRIHESMSNFENFLVREIKIALHERWLHHSRLFFCFTDWMMKLIKLFSGGDKEIPEITESDENSDWLTQPSSEIYDENKAFGDPTIFYARNKIAQDVDKSMNNLMKTMYRVSKYQSVNDRSTLACLANNLLLVAIFMETISFVSALFCIGNDHETDANSSDMYNSWRNRSKRESLLLEYFSTMGESEENSTVQYANKEYYKLHDELMPYPEFSRSDDVADISTSVRTTTTEIQQQYIEKIK